MDEGGVWGGSVDSRARPISGHPGAKALGSAQLIAVSYPAIPPSFPGSADRPPSHPRGGGAPGREGGMVGLRDGSTPQVPAPTRIAPGSSASQP